MNTRVKFPFPQNLRLKNRSDFNLTKKQGTKFCGNWITILYRKNHLESTRLGITVSRKFGKAVKRNRFKRITREAFRYLYTHLPKSLDINVLPRRKALFATSEQLKEDLLRFIQILNN